MHSPNKALSLTKLKPSSLLSSLCISSPLAVNCIRAGTVSRNRGEFIRRTVGNERAVFVRRFGTTHSRGLVSSSEETVSMADNPTLVRPPPLDPKKSAIENVLELTELAAIGPSLYTNTRPLWHPPGARGIYGGAVIAQCLSAAQLTVPTNFTVHSMHCYFVLAGDSALPVIYHVEHVRDGKSFATRTVQARQKGQPIFTTTMSFVREKSGGKEGNMVEHSTPMPVGVVGSMPEAGDGDDVRSSEGKGDEEGWSPFVAKSIGILNNASPDASTKKTRQWLRCRGKISPAGGHAAHLSALAYMSDSYFIGTVARIHGLLRRGETLKTSSSESTLEEKKEKPKREIGMMVSLDHTIFFHEPRGFRADEWMFTECESPWSGDGRGVVMQKMWGSDGRLVATCFQEGVIRLKPDGSEVGGARL